MEQACNEGISWGHWLLMAPLIVMVWALAIGLVVVLWRIFVSPGMDNGLR